MNLVPGVEDLGIGVLGVEFGVWGWVWGFRDKSSGLRLSLEG